ncbi:MAG: putative ABC-type amino acid transport-system, periplasmatic component [Deferribacteraceae bacterium]|nr:putative ABC-type amino acid transport-system, periplasmatic component [Deferribacteraceae bacterium]
MKFLRILSLFILFTACAFAGNISTLERIENTGKIRVGFRDNLYPFSFTDEKGRFRGFAYDIASLFNEKLSQHLNKKIEMIPVKITTQNRFEYVLNDKIDIEIGSTSYSFKREELVDFSIIYFFSETSILAYSQKINNITDLNNKIIGVTKNTTNEESLLKFLKENNISPSKIVYLNEHFDSVENLKNKEIDAFCSDRTILYGVKKILNSENFIILNTPIGYEPYAFMMKENNSDFRDFVNNFIVWMVKTGKYFEIYEKWFDKAPVSPFLKNYFSVISYDLPENW